MADEIIDLTVPPSPGSPGVLRLRASVYSKRVQLRRPPRPFTQNPNLCYTSQQQMTPWVYIQSSSQTYGLTPNVCYFQPNIHGDQPPAAAVYEPVTQSNAASIPEGANLDEPWSPKEHELFLMGLAKFGRGCWSRIAKHFLWNKTPQQIQSYAESFFGHQPATYSYNYSNMDPPCPVAIAKSVTNLMNPNESPMGANPMSNMNPPCPVTISNAPANLMNPNENPMGANPMSYMNPPCPVAIANAPANLMNPYENLMGDNFMGQNQNLVGVDLIGQNENLIGASASASFYNPVMAWEPLPITLHLFPEAPFTLQVPPAREGCSNSHGFQMQTGAGATASTSMNACDGVDLELRLG